MTPHYTRPKPRTLYTGRKDMKTRKPSNNYTDDPVITALAIGIVAAWVIFGIVVIKWALGG